MSRVLALLTVVVLALVALWLGFATAGDGDTSSADDIESATDVQVDDVTAPVARTPRRPPAAPSAEEEEEEPPAATVAEERTAATRELRIETTSGAPIPLIRVHWSVAGQGQGKGVTGADGRLQPAIEARADATVELDLDGWKHELAPGVDRLVLPGARPLEIRVVDTRTGETLDPPRLLGGDVELPAEGLWLARGTSGRLDFPEVPGLLEGARTELQLDGLGPRSRVANGYRIALPMRPAFSVPLRWVCDDDPGHLQGFVEYSASRVPSLLRDDANGGLVTRTFPFFRGERVTATVSSGTHGGSASATVLEPGRQPELVVALTPRSHEPEADDDDGIRTTLGVGGGARNRRPTGSLVIQAYRRDGTPAAGIDVHRGGTTDENGVVRIDALAAGPQSIRFDEPGVVPSSTEVNVEADATTHVVLREREGRTVTLVSRDHDGVLLRYARVTVHQPSYVTYVSIDERGIVDLALWTDAQGRITLRNLEDRDLKFTVRYGSRRASVSAAVDQGYVEAVFKPLAE